MAAELAGLNDIIPVELLEGRIHHLKALQVHAHRAGANGAATGMRRARLAKARQEWPNNQKAGAKTSG